MSKLIVTPTRGESLLIRRRRNKLNQVQAAAEYGVHLDVYRDWEADRRVKDQPRKVLGHLKNHEACFIQRRRTGLSQKQLAERLDCTRLWVNQMENDLAPCDRLVEYWRL